MDHRLLWPISIVKSEKKNGKYTPVSSSSARFEQRQRNLDISALLALQEEGNRIILAGAGEPVVIFVIEIANHERRRTIADVPKDIGC